jgi:putative ABC transport system permease protein
MSILAFVLSVLLALFALPWFNSFTGKSFDILDIYNWQTVPYLVLGVLILGILSGLYPAFYLSSFKPLEVLKSKPGRRVKGISFRGTLVVFQFVISIFLIIGTLVVYQQMKYIQDVNLGFNKDQIIILHGADALGNKIETFKESLLSNHNIRHISASHTLPGKEFMNWGCGVEGREGLLTLNMNLTDFDFLQTYEMQMAAGRYFSKDFPSDSSAIVINENALNVFGWEDPIERKINMNGQSLHVIGVIKDYHYESLHSEIRPMGMILLPNDWDPTYLSVKVSGEEVHATLSLIEAKWEEITGGYPYHFSFFNQEYQKLYDNEAQTSAMFIFFAVIAIFIACLGLFALSAFVAAQRTKEIGIRKVNGAGINNILVLLSSNFTKWVLIAFTISLPLGVLVMQKWLDNFAYKTNLHWWIFALAGFAALLIAILTVSFQSIKAAVKNPIDALRYE